MLETTHVKRAAFTMIELVFVIVILGIVASIGAEIVVKVYESYITQRAIHKSSLKTELAATQVANRLAYSIPGTVIGRVVGANTFETVDNIPFASTDRNILEWIAYDADSFGAVTSSTTSGFERRPVWSGYADVNATIVAGNVNQVITPGSRLSDLNSIIVNLRPSGSTTSITNATLFFPDTYFVTNIGYDTTSADISGTHPVSGATGETTLTLDARANRTFKEHYKLAWTAYAVVPTALTNAQKTDRGFETTDALWDLTFHYDYQPWEGEGYANGSSQILIRNVSVFNFTGTGDTVRFKICQRESIGGEYTINTCKEKAVIR